MGSPKKPMPAPGSADSTPAESVAAEATTPGLPYAARTVLVVDNGGSHIKAMLVQPGQAVRLVVVPNCVGAAAYAGRGIVGEQLLTLPHYHGFMVRRPTDRGFIVDAVLQAHVWEYVLQRLGVDDERGVELVLTVPFATPKPVSALLYVLVSSRFHFAAVTVVSSHFLTLLSRTLRPHPLDDDKQLTSATKERKRARQEPASQPGLCAANLTGTAIVVDVGFSGTTVVPYIDGLPVCASIVRLSVGGKLLTNRLKEHLSFAQVNVLEDGWLINHVRERCCYVARAEDDKDGRMWRPRLATASLSSEKGKRPIPTVLYYLPTIPALLPLGCTEKELPSRVRLRSHEPSETALSSSSSSTPAGHENTAGSVFVEAASLQCVRLAQEAFLIPELLFCPADVGVTEMGLVQAITHGIFERGLLQQLPLLRHTLLHKVWVFGGVANTSGFLARLDDELKCARRTLPSTALRGASSEWSDALVSAPDDPLPAPFRHVLTAPGASEKKDRQRQGGEAGALTSCAELAPLLGAFYLLEPTQSTAVDTSAAERRATVQQLLYQRSRVALTEAAKRSSEGDLYTALQRLL